VTAIGGVNVVTGLFVVGYLEEHVLQHLTGSSKHDFSDQVLQKKLLSSHGTGVVGGVVTGGSRVVTVAVVTGGGSKLNLLLQVLQHFCIFASQSGRVHESQFLPTS